MNYNFGVEQRNLERVATIRRAERRPASQIKQRIAQKANELDRTGRQQSHLEVCIEALAGLVNMLYRTDDVGETANVDRATGLILIPVPWSDGGSKRWGLRQWEARVLRRIILDRAQSARPMPPLFDFSGISNRWYLNRTDYPTTALGLVWVKHESPTLKEWRAALDEFHQNRARYYQSHGAG